MTSNNKIPLKVTWDTLSPHEWDSKYTFDIITTVPEVEAKKNKINRVLDNLNFDINWPDAPTYHDVLEMVDFGSQCWIFMYEDLACGWYWCNTENYTVDFKSSVRKLNPDEVYLGTGTVSRRDKVSPEFSYYAFRQAIEGCLAYNKKQIGYLYCDDWNVWSIRLCKACGMFDYNFIDE